MNTNQTKFRSTRTMPQWVNANNPPIGPKPAPIPSSSVHKNGTLSQNPPPLPKKNPPDPDYEVIEFGGQQYSNAGGIPPIKNEGNKKIKCELCGGSVPTIRCDQCEQHLFCSSCDDMYHRHPKRQNHVRKFMEQLNDKPPLPPKGEGIPLPVPPPRRNKKLSSHPMVPHNFPPHPIHTQKIQPPPSPSLSIRERMGTLKRMINPSTRPLPPTPDQMKMNHIEPNSRNAPSPFDSIKRAPSLTMEKINNHTMAALDRMTQLQQRYKQHREAMASDSDRSRRISGSSDIDVQAKIEQLRIRQANMLPNARNLSTSVFDLNNTQHNNMMSQIPNSGGAWSTNPMQQAQSMSQLNNPNHMLGSWQQPMQPHWSNQFDSGSNSSLNLPPPPPGFFYPQQTMDNRAPPPVWMNSWGMPPMYPYPMGMMPMTPLPTHRSRPSSRNHSRAGSPALSLKSRRSVMSSRSHQPHNFTRDLTDDEDSDLSDRELNMKSNSRSKRTDTLSQKSGSHSRNHRHRTNSSGLEFDNIESDNKIMSDRAHHTDKRNKSKTNERQISKNNSMKSPSPSVHLINHQRPQSPLIKMPIPVKNEQNIKSSAFKPIVVKDSSDTESDIKELKLFNLEPPTLAKAEESDDDNEAQSTQNIQQKPINVNPEPLREDVSVDDLGPPPTPPDHEWECEFCTYVNEPKTKFCFICCKTPTHKPNSKKIISAMKINTSEESSSDATGMAKEISSKPEMEAIEEKPEQKISEPLKQDENKLNDKVDTKNEIDHKIDISNKEIEKIDKIPEVEEKKETKTVEKVSTSCGTSPIKELEKNVQKSENVTEDNSKKEKENKPEENKRKISTGTSPPPQNMSTQTYEEVIQSKIEDSENNRPGREARPSESRRVRRSHSMVNRRPETVQSDYHTIKPLSHASYSSDESIPSPSLLSTSRKYDFEHTLADEETLAYLNKTLNSHSLHRNRRRSEERFRSIGDLRRSDSYRLRKSSLFDYPIRKKPLDDLTIEDIIQLKKQEESFGPNGVELIRLLREAENYKFNAEDLQAALNNCRSLNPITWLRENWTKLIDTVQTLSTKYGQERRENNIGTLSSIEARDALRKHKGNVWQAITECIEQRQKKFNEISSHGNYSREDIVTSLTANHGNVDMALVELQKTQVKPFLMKIWGPPTGAENESGNFLYEDNLEKFSDDPQSLENYSGKSSKVPDGAMSSLSSSSMYSDRRELNEIENPHNSNLLRDLEVIIGNMEKNQAEQKGELLNDLQNLLGNVLTKHQYDKSLSSSSSNFLSASQERLNRKSPIIIPTKNIPNFEDHTLVESDVRRFMSQHIQDVVPDLVEQIQKEIHIENDNEIVLLLPNSNDSRNINDLSLSSLNREDFQEIKQIENTDLPLTPTEIIEQTPNQDTPSQTPNENVKEEVKSAYPVEEQQIHINNNQTILGVYPPVEPPKIVIQKDNKRPKKMSIRKGRRSSNVHKNKKEETKSQKSDENETNVSTEIKETIKTESLPPSTDAVEQKDIAQPSTSQSSKVSEGTKHMLKPKSNKSRSRSNSKEKKKKEISPPVVEVKTENENNVLNTEIESEIKSYVNNIVNVNQDKDLTYVDKETPQTLEVNENNLNDKESSDEEFADPIGSFPEPNTPTDPPEYIPTIQIQTNENEVSNPNDESQSNRQSQNLSDLVLDTQRLIKQMKDEIASDIASMVSGEEHIRDSDDESGSLGWTDDDDFDEEELEEEEEEEEEEEGEDDESYLPEEEEWTDITSHTSTDDEHIDEIELIPNKEETTITNEIKTENVATILESENSSQKISEKENQNIVTDEVPSSTEVIPNAEKNNEENKVDIADEPVQNVSEDNSHTSVEEISIENKTPNDIVHTVEIIPVLQTEQIIPQNEPSKIQENSIEDTPVSLDDNQVNDKQEIQPNETEQKNIEEIRESSITPTNREVIESTSLEDTLQNEIDNKAEVSENQEPKESTPTTTTTTTTAPNTTNNNEVLSKTVITTIETTETITTTTTIEPPTQSSPAASQKGAVRKIPVRRKSLTNTSQPTLNNRSSNIKNIQSKFLNNQTAGSNTDNNKNTSTVLKKTTPITVKSVMRPNSSSFPANNNNNNVNSNSKIPKPIITTTAVKNIPPASTSKVNLVEKSQNLPVSGEYEKQKIPKKKYIESCFSDYIESSDEEVVNTKQDNTQTVKRNFYQLSKSIDDHENLLQEDPQTLVKRFLDEGKVKSQIEAELVVSLLNLNFDINSAFWASEQCQTIDEALNLLQQECELCMEKYPMNEFISMLKCTHKCCKYCAKNYFTVQITERSITDCSCPFCKLPELHDPELNEDDVIEYISNLDILLKNILDTQDHELFQRKLRDRTLMQDPNFKWCIECSSGFIASPKQKVLECPDCHSRTCASCRKPWEEQHKGISCEKFAEWKQLNDPETQNEGVVKHLQLHGIECPKCKFKYSLVRGGCIHFTCTQCKYEFCYGCGKPFMMGAKCKVSNYCGKLGLHAHHPRNCFFYLRDKEPHELQNLLRMFDIPFETEEIKDIKGENTGAYSMHKCPMPVQKETPAGLVDTVCNGDVIPNNAGLCREHYVEYLVNRIYKENIDPLPILDLNDCIQELKRRGIPLPERGPWDDDRIYREMCQKIVQEQIPLN